MSVHLFSGDDTRKKHAAYGKLMKSIPADVEKFFIGKNDFDRAQVESLYSGVGLFFKQCVVVFKNISERREAFDFLLNKLSLLQSSPNCFVFLEGKMFKSDLEVFGKSGGEVGVFDLPKAKKEKYNNFLLANDLGARNRFDLWLHFRQAVDLGVGLEELVGVLFWKAKDMILKKNLGRFKEAELKNFAGRLSYILPEARKLGRDAECEMERFLLEAV